MMNFARATTPENPGGIGRRRSTECEGAGAGRKTNAIEKALLMTAIVLLPLEDHIAPFGGFSIMFLVFAAMGSYAVWSNPGNVIQAAKHPVMVAGYVFLVICAVMESFGDRPEFFAIRRYALMLGGAVVVASLCRDMGALRATMYGYLIMGLWLSLLLTTSFYDDLAGASAYDFYEAGKVRGQVVEENPIKANLNKMSFQCAEAAVVALAMALVFWNKGRARLHVLLGVCLVCWIGVLMPMSRGGLIIGLVASIVVCLAYREGRAQSVIALLVIAMGILLAAPSVTFTRMTSTISSDSISSMAKEDGRMRVWIKAMEHLPDYMMTGVGYGNYWERWARAKGVHVAHNGFLQIMIYWGIAGGFAFVLVLWQAYRCLPFDAGAHALSLCLIGISICLLLRLMVSHNVADKDFSLGFGLLVAASAWIWRRGAVGVQP